MNKHTSLSDSSTSDSEEDHGRKLQQHLESKLDNCFSVAKVVNPVFKNDETEDHELKFMDPPESVFRKDIRSKTHYYERGSSTSDSEEDHGKKMMQLTMPSLESWSSVKQYSTDDTDSEELKIMEPPRKMFKRDEFRSPTRYHERALSGSESDDQSSNVRSFSMELNSNNAQIEDTTKPAVFNNVAQKIMQKMGFKEGTGLGKYGQGRTQIVEASKQRGRRGLGLHLKELEPSNAEWDFAKEHVSVEEEVIWLPSCTEEPPSMAELRTWVKEGLKKLTIEDETEFCDPSVLQNVLACKSVFDSLEPEEMRRARTRSNPFETVRGVIFQNRAAMKMANMDAVFEFMFTNPKDEDGKSLVGPQELLYFADVCAGPGGFSEYILWRKKWESKGFGFTLKGPNDFKLEEFFAGPVESFEPHYGVSGIEGDGNVYIPQNLREFHRFVMNSTDGKGVHFVMADGGFSVEGQENIQEILSKRLYLCQFLCALLILRTGGHFVCKLFDLFTPFSVGLIYLMYRIFRKVCIHKPNTSRPANSERYIICKWRRENTKDICDYMFEINCRLEQLSGAMSKTDVTEIVPLDNLRDDQQFFEYIVESNNILGEKQIIHLAKIKAFAQNTELYEERQSDFRKQCLAAWKIPDKVRSAPSRPDPNARFKELMQGEKTDYLSIKHEELNLKQHLFSKSIYDFRCMVCGAEQNKQERAFFLGLGRSHIFRWDGTTSTKWTKIDATLELPSDTLVYAELIQELKGEGKAQRKILCLHIIDALFLGGKDVRNVHFMERINLAQKLVKAVSKPSRSDYTPIKVKELWRFEEISQVLNRLVMKMVKGFGGIHRLCYKMEDGRHFLPSGLLFIRTVEDPWMMAFSRKNRRKYHFNTQTQISVFEYVKEATANFKSCYSKRVFWSWERGVQLMQGQEANDDKIHGHTIVSLVQNVLSSNKSVMP